MATVVQRVKGNPEIRYYYCASASPAFKKGDLVKLDSSGTLVIGTAGAILGIAMKDAPASTTTYVPVDIVSPQGEFLVSSSGSTATTDVADIKDFDFTTTAVTTTTDSAHDCVIVGLYDAAGTSGGRYYIKFSAGSCQGGAYAT